MGVYAGSLIRRGRARSQPPRSPVASCCLADNTDTQNHDPSTPRDHCFDSGELGEYLGLSIRSIDRLRLSGAISYRCFGHQIRFAPEDIDQFLAQSRVAEGASS